MDGRGARQRGGARGLGQAHLNQRCPFACLSPGRRSPLWPLPALVTAAAVCGAAKRQLLTRDAVLPPPPPPAPCRCPARPRNRALFPGQEDKLLASWQAKMGNRWSAVAQHMPGRTGQQCAQRWRHKVNPFIRKDKWTEEEDKKLSALHKEFGNKWAEIARRLEGRTDQQCMGRWRRHLDPTIKKESWSTDEDQRLIELHKTHGSSWYVAPRCLPGRTLHVVREIVPSSRSPGS